MAEIRNGGTGIGDAMRDLMSGIERNDPEMVASARTSQMWARVADDAQRSHTDAVYTVPGTRGSEVVVYVDSNIWATELALQGEILRLRMNMAFQEMMREDGVPESSINPERIKKLRFSASNKRYRGKRADDVSISQQLLDEGMHIDATPVPLTAEELAEIEEEVSGIQDPVIRKAAAAAMQADLELKKGMLA